MSIKETEQGGIKTTYKHYTISAIFIGNQCAKWSDDNWHNSLITLLNRNTKRSISFDFWGSLMNPELRTHDDLLNAFHCFIPEGISGQQDYEQFCQSFGYGDDSRKAHATWKACQKSLLKIERIINEDINDFYRALSGVAG